MASPSSTVSPCFEGRATNRAGVRRSLWDLRGEVERLLLLLSVGIVIKYFPQKVYSDSDVVYGVMHCNALSALLTVAAMVIVMRAVALAPPGSLPSVFSYQPVLPHSTITDTVVCERTGWLILGQRRLFK